MQAEDLKRAIHGFSCKMRFHLATLVYAAALMPELIEIHRQFKTNPTFTHLNEAREIGSTITVQPVVAVIYNT
jgi:hypothetical protein